MRFVIVELVRYIVVLSKDGLISRLQVDSVTNRLRSARGRRLLDLSNSSAEQMLVCGNSDVLMCVSKM